ncbi:MAG TPA: cysteine--tRNA ligase [Phycisphaerales bacterium]|nr:cysteine--tRNA ligase [Phycisphaerales bacterium]
MPLRLYNTLSKSIEEFKPLDSAGKSVSFYSCGPTVYDFAHIGNFRSFLNADLLRRTLELLGYTVRHVMNMTDVGHMTDDESADGSGEDKMTEAGRRLLEQKKSGKLPADALNVDPNNPYAIADFYIRAFLEDARALGLKVALEQQSNPELMPRPTQYVPQMVALIESLIKTGHAYVGADGVVYFSVQSFPAYGALSGNTLDKIRSGEGGRVSAETQALKRHPADFMLWKPDPTHVMKWPSPWGEGYPGWHLECSVMAESLLGSHSSVKGEIDLHSGGEDNIFPHHECEIAQSCAFTRKPLFARYWFHTRHLMVEGRKMSKSKGNFYTLRDLLSRGVSPAAIRLELTKTHYRSNANFTFQGLEDSQRMINRWFVLRDRLSAAVGSSGGAPQVSTDAHPALADFTASLCDDLNVAGAIASLNQFTSSLTEAPAASPQDRAILETMLRTLGLLDLQTVGKAAVSDDLAALVSQKLAERADARKSKNFKRSDEIRDELLALGVAIKDSKEGTTWTRVILGN